MTSREFELWDGDLGEPEFFPAALWGGPGRLQVHEIVTIPEDWVTPSIGTDAPETLMAMEEAGFDYAPVKHPGVPCGWTLVSVGVLRELARTQQKLSTSSAFESEVTFEVDDYFAADLLDLLRALEQRPALLIVRNNPAQVVGLLTSADLNRHAVRRMLFDRLSFVEEQLSKLVRRSFSADDDWLRFLPEDTQARVLGWHELSKRRNIHGSPVTHLTFPELVRIVKSARGVYRQLGFGSSSETDDYFGTCVAVRNRVMHATKPLVRSPEDVPQLRIALERCTAFETRVASGNFESGDSAR